MSFINWLECRTCGVGVGVHTVDVLPGSAILEAFRREHEGHRLTMNGLLEPPDAGPAEGAP